MARALFSVMNFSALLLPVLLLVGLLVSPATGSMLPVIPALTAASLSTVSAVDTDSVPANRRTALVMWVWEQMALGVWSHFWLAVAREQDAVSLGVADAA